MNQPIKSFHDLLVWQKSMDLVVECYRISKLLPREETYGLISQIQRSAVSVPANIAEGHGRDHLGDYLRHLSMAKGSLTELETHLLIAVRLTFLTESHVQSLFERIAEVGRMLSGLSGSLAQGLPST